MFDSLKEDSEEGMKQREILRAAMEEFVDRGWSGARMQGIADRADINKTLLHYYFRSKKNLYDRVLEVVLHFFFSSAFSRINFEDPIQDILRSLVHTVVDGAEKNPRIPMFIMQELSRGGDSARAAIKNVITGGDINPKMMLDRLQLAVDRGEIKAINPPQIMLTVIGSSLYFAMIEPILAELTQENTWVNDFDRQAFIEERKESICTVLFHGLLPDEGEQE